MALFDPFCHQLPDRSFALAGVPFALCHRCFGVVAGLAAGAVAAPALARLLDPAGGRGLPALAVAAVPMALDWLLDVAGVWTNTPVSRFATGVVFGLAAGALLVLTAAAPVRAAAAVAAISAPPGRGDP
jgi:uncharacterized membrane protein